jgi:hypothetical protein
MLKCVVRDLFLITKPDALIIQIYSVIKDYIFRATSLSIIRSFLLYIRHWQFSCRFWWPFPSRVRMELQFHPDSAWKQFLWNLKIVYPLLIFCSVRLYTYLFIYLFIYLYVIYLKLCFICTNIWSKKTPEVYVRQICPCKNKKKKLGEVSLSSRHQIEWGSTLAHSVETLRKKTVGRGLDSHWRSFS